MGNSERPKILIVDDVREYLYSLENALGREFNILAAVSMDEAKEVMNEGIELVLLDIRLNEEPQNRDGILLLEWCKKNYPHKPVVMMSSHRDFDMAVDALNLGASYFLRKPINIPQLKALLRNIIEQARLSEENVRLRKKLSEYEDKA